MNTMPLLTRSEDFEADSKTGWDWRQDDRRAGLMYNCDEFKLFIVGRCYSDTGTVEPWKPKLYVNTDGDFDVDEDLMNRTRRPYTLYRNFIEGVVWPTIGLAEAPKLGWRQNAGCSACPCSPGFVVSHGDADETRIWFEKEIVMPLTGRGTGRNPEQNGLFPLSCDMYLTIKVPFTNVDVSKPARHLVAV